MLNGFADTNAKMREETLKNLACVVEKLDERNLQDKLVRCVTGLQNDAEASIRTNAVIFIGRIASRLKEGVRTRVLCNSLLKALKDSFVHCRISGLKASLACMTYIDIPQLAGKMIPTVSVLTLDRNTDVRELALNFIDVGMAQLKQNHMTMKQQAEKDKASAIENAESATAGQNSNDNNSSSLGSFSGWSSFSWSAVDGLAKSIEKTIVTSPTEKTHHPPTSSNNATNTLTPPNSIGGSNLNPTTSRTAIPPSSSTATNSNSSTAISTSSSTRSINTNKGGGGSGGWDDDIDITLDHNKSNEEDEEVTSPYSYKPSINNNNRGWDDDVLDINDDKDDDKPVKMIIDKKNKSANNIFDTPNKTNNNNNNYTTGTGMTLSNSSHSTKSVTMSANKAKKPMAVKLAVSENESWDDF